MWGMVKQVKVIGKTKNGYILEASRDDIAGIQGMYGHSANIEIGTIIDIEGLFKKYSNVNSAFNDISRLRQTAEMITSAADWIEQFKKGLL